MNDDELLDALAHRARVRWSETSASEPSDPEADLPPTEEEGEAMMAAVFARLDADGGADSDSTEAEPDTPSAPATVVPIRRWPGRVAAWVGAAAAVAAIALLWFARSPDIAALPDYADGGFSGGAAQMRGDPVPAESATPRLTPDSVVQWRLRPSTAVQGAVGLRILAVGAETRCLDPGDAVRVSEQGAIELRGPASSVLPLPPGRWQLTAIVGRTEAMTAHDDPCAWRAQGTTTPDGLLAAGEATIELVDDLP